MGRKLIVLKSRISYPGGLEKAALRYSKAFAQKGCEVIVLTTNYNQKQPKDFAVINLGRAPKSSLMHLVKFNQWCHRWLSNQSYDIVFGLDRNNCYQSHYRAGNGVHAAYLANRQLTSSWLKSLDLRYNPRHRMILRYERQTYTSKSLSALFTPSAMVKNEIVHYYQVNPDKIHVCYDRFPYEDADIGFHNWLACRDKIRRVLSLDVQAIQILFVGHDYARKGLEYLLRGLACFPKSHFQLSVVGKNSHEAKYIALSKRLGLANKVKFFGLQTDVIKFYQMADVFALFPSYDPLAGAGCEALSMGLFTILSSKVGSSELLNPDSGRVVDYPDTSALISALGCALEHPKTAQSAMKVRDTVKHLLGANQRNRVIDLTLA